MTEAKLRANLNSLKSNLLELPPKDLISLYYDLQERVETYEMMALAESGFEEWLEPGEDIYDE
jgi:hypothetical protein